MTDVAGTGMRKALISVFIVISIATQVLQNLNVPYVRDDPQAPYAARVATWTMNQVHWGFETYGFYTGTNVYWRMFSPVHRYDWWWRIEGVMDQGVRDLPSPSATGHQGAEAFFTDFRETKILLNLWPRPLMQAAYADYLCQGEARAGRPLRSVRLEMYWRNILPPAEAAARGDHRDDHVSSTVMGEYPCRS